MIVVISGPGGVGKGTVVARLLQLDPQLWLSRSWTTRPRRSGEGDDAYTFVDRDTFLARAEAGGFEEWTEFAGNGQLYGTPTVDPPAGQDAVFEIELHGARQVKARHPDALLILIVAPSLEVQEARMRARGDDDEHIKRRLEVGQQEEEVGRQIADEVVINDDVDRAAREVAGILQQYR